MPAYARVTDLDEFPAPWGRWIRLQEIEYQGGLVMLRVRIREGTRFTDLELTGRDAGHLADRLRDWAGRQPPAAEGTGPA